MLGFLLTAIVVELTPGPNMATLASLTLRHGRRGGFAIVAGITLGLGIVGTLAAFGLAELIANTRYAQQILRWGGVLYMLYLAYDTWRDPPPGEHFNGRSSLFLRGLTINLLNPKSAVFYLAVLPNFIDPARGGVFGQTFLLVAIYLAVGVTVHSSLVLLAGRLRPLLIAGAGERTVRRIASLAMIAIAAWFVFETR